jgi:1,4-dihydroxy-2-naphthoate polyprenyltransferase
MEIIEIQKQMPRWKAWLLASRPQTLTVALIPVLAATALAKGTFFLAFFAFLTSLCIQIGTNLINDALDFKKGADTSTRLGPLRISQSGIIPMHTIYRAGLLLFFLAFLFAMPLIMKGGSSIGMLVVVSIALGYLYTGGPKPLAYYGLGDLFVFLFFGLVSTAAIYYIQSGEFSPLALLAGAQIGLLATLLIALNNLRDIEGDRKVGKKTLAVYSGLFLAKVEITLLALSPFVLNLLWFKGDYHLAALLPWLTLPLALSLLKSIWTTAPSSIYNTFFKRAALLHFLFGLFLSLSLFG